VDKALKAYMENLPQPRPFYLTAITETGLIVMALLRPVEYPLQFFSLAAAARIKPYRILFALRRLQDYGIVDCFPGAGWDLTRDFGLPLFDQLRTQRPSELSLDQHQQAARRGRAFARAFVQLRCRPSYRLDLTQHNLDDPLYSQAWRTLAAGHRCFRFPPAVVDALQRWAPPEQPAPSNR
jgi:hypothetical protein